jgi:L-seryl-tRNA(Ser) seleniumtransferase
LYVRRLLGSAGAVDSNRALSRIPSVDRLLAAAWVQPLLERHARSYVVECLRHGCDELRAEIRAGRLGQGEVEAEIERRVLAIVARARHARPANVVNATGVVLHTNLGRALLPEEAIASVVHAARNPSALEFDLATGKRGERDDLVAEDLLALTGAEAATIVNNNAAAVLLALNTVAEGREVIVSRGELIEIGGSFRIPDVMMKSGAHLREVGTTNRTHPRDYADAIGPDTAAVLKVHTSNYKVVGFTAEVGLEELVEIAHARGLPVIEDLGSGALVDLSPYGLPKEPVVSERVACGADLVTFSGDKLLGGPQAGLIVGKKDLVRGVAANPLKRALRCGKLTLAALSAVVKIYRRSPDLGRELPTLRALARPLAEIGEVARAALCLLRPALGAEFTLELVDSTAEIGSGALPTEPLPSKAIAIAHRSLGPDAIAARFRAASPPIIGRIEKERFLLDLRTIFDPAALVPRD